MGVGRSGVLDPILFYSTTRMYDLHEPGLVDGALLLGNGVVLLLAVRGDTLLFFLNPVDQCNVIARVDQIAERRKQ